MLLNECSRAAKGRALTPLPPPPPCQGRPLDPRLHAGSQGPGWVRSRLPTYVLTVRTNGNPRVVWCNFMLMDTGLEKPGACMMVGKPTLHYFNGRGRMESIGWLLAAAGVEFEEKFIETPEDLDKLRNDGSLMFQQVPMVEIDGMKLVQTRAILNYIATKYNLYGKDIKERAFIDMYAEGIADINEMIMLLPICPPNEKDAKIALIKEKTTNRYLPVFENVLKSHGQDYLVGNRLSKADVHLVELLYYVEEFDPSLLVGFPLLKALKSRISNLPTVKKFLQPGGQRKPPVDEKSLEKAKKIFRLK